jgi:16S rRNA (guanine527-N7)-methyltransferase
MDTVADRFSQSLAEQGIELSSRQIDQFAVYCRELREWNERMNLTAITEREEVYFKHFYDSLTLSAAVPFSAVHTMADIGSGAGFPGIPLKIVFPHISLTIIDSLQKRIRFLQHLTDALGLREVRLLHGRAEDLGKMAEHREQYDIAAARAVARLNVLNELCLPFVRTDGFFLAMKGSDLQDEITEAEFSLRELKSRVDRIVPVELPVVQAKRHIVVIRKLQSTPRKYPRKTGTPARNPLIKT